MRQNSMIGAVKDSVKKYLWYLTELLVIFCLFDEDIDSVWWKAMGTRLSLLLNQRRSVPGKPQFLVILMVDNQN